MSNVDWQWKFLSFMFALMLVVNLIICFFMLLFILIGICIGLLSNPSSFSGPAHPLAVGQHTRAPCNWKVRFGYIDRNLRRIQGINQGNIPKQRWRDLDRGDVEDSENFMNTRTCVICHEVMNEESFVTDLPVCNHLYHHKCISEWFKVNSKCPICKHDYLDEFRDIREPADR